MNAVGGFKDLPKVEGKPKPNEPLVWTVYVTSEGKMRARVHPAGQPAVGWFDAEILQPENFLGHIEKWKAMQK